MTTESTNQTTEADKAQYRLWHIPQIPGKSFKVESSNLEYLANLCDVLQRYDLFQYENNIKPDYVNISGIEVWEDVGEGYHWYSLDDCEVSDIIGYEFVS